MAKKKYNLNPKALSEAIDVIKTMEADWNTEITQFEQERDNYKQKWQESNQKYQQLLTNQRNLPLSDDEIITQAKKLGMKTKEEYQTALTKDSKNTSDKEVNDYSGLYAAGGIAVIVLGWTWLKNKAKNS